MDVGRLSKLFVEAFVTRDPAVGAFSESRKPAEPKVNRAAVPVVRRFGYRVAVPKLGTAIFHYYPPESTEEK